VTGVAPPTGRPRPARRRRRLWPVLLVVAGVAAAFALGVAVGEALRDAPQPGGKRTDVRTLRPVTVSPTERTVTVVVTG
jgi:type IV pilus biogenesis protein CpaD/CtpE